MSVEMTDDVGRVVTSGRLAHMVTLNLDGSPQVSLVWVGLDGDRIVSGHMGAWRKVDNLRRDPRVSLSMEAAGTNDHGLDHYLVVHGHAEVVEGGAAPLLQRLARVYLGPDVRFPSTDDPTLGYVLRITADRIGGIGPWVVPG
jgi:PPOX class probable F420-dependent enzyme